MGLVDSSCKAPYGGQFRRVDLSVRYTNCHNSVFEVSLNLHLYSVDCIRTCLFF